MVGKKLWQQLKLLAECDEVIVEIQKNINILKEEQLEKLYAVEDLEEELAEKQAAGQVEKKNVALQELYAKELAERQEVLRKKSKEVTHQKELDALDREKFDLSRKQEAHDVVLMRAWQNRDNVFKQLEQQKVQLEQKAQLVKESATAYDATIQALEQRLQETMQQRSMFLQDLDDEWRKRYERVKNTVKDPIISLIQNSCGACFYLVASKDLVDLKQEHVIICRNCYRFIYQEEMPAVRQAAP